MVNLAAPRDKPPKGRDGRAGHFAAKATDCTRQIRGCAAKAARREEALRRIQEILGALGLELHPDKTKVVELGIGKEGFDFLGGHFRVVHSHFTGKRCLFRWPSQRAIGMRDIREVIAVLNPLLIGWGNDFRTGNATECFTSVDRYVTERLVRLIGAKRRWAHRPFHARTWSHRRFVEDFGLHKLLGTIRYPGGVHAT
jgi:RNA-directed DNA polymerase